ncbi:MAG: Type 1 glutamine amidotransferase-like domain-containing protein [Clostridia bacterium]|nr:Type 1 glutamine amidotransferase-like domain-containing protein [Clostridia bacterium]
MKKKIVAIGGGECGRITKSGNKMPYETKEIDAEIIRLTEKKKPNFLFIGHAQSNEQNERNYFEAMSAIYENIFGCECKTILKSDLSSRNSEIIKKSLCWADIIYVGGGDTKGMLKLWSETGFDKLLQDAWLSGKVMCGLSAGANCWFNSCCSDSLKLELNDNTAPMIDLYGLDLLNAYFTPHCDYVSEYSNRLEHMKNALVNRDIVGIGISNCCAIEIVDNKYRLICCDASNYGIEAYGVKAYYKNNEYFCEHIDKSDKYKPLGELLNNSNATL